MNTEPKITQEHLDAAADQMSGYELMLDFVNKVIEIALAEQQEGEYITAAQARELGVGNAEIRNAFGDWVICQGNIYGYPNDAKYRAIKQAQPEPVGHIKLLGEIYGFLQSSCPEGIADEAFRVVPESLRAQAIAKYVGPRDDVGECVRHTQEVGRIEVDSHAELRAEYIRQRDAVPCELGFYLWEGKNANSSNWQDATGFDIFFAKDCEYRYTDISCYVSKDGDTAVRMLRTDAQKLQRETKDTHDWFMPNNLDVGIYFEPTFRAEGTYTYRTKATIKLNGNMVTPEQAAAEREAKKDTHELWYRSDRLDWCIWSLKQWNKVENHNEHYELRPKQPTWTGSREDVIALLKEVGVL
jgi:hypothetical protein